MGSNPTSSEKHYFTLKMFFYIKISAKEKTSISKFLDFLAKIKLFSFVQLNQIPKKKQRKFVTVLKSPHVNKTAQEQFEFRIYVKQLVMFSAKPALSFFILKKIKNSTFSGIKLEIKCLFEKTRKNKRLLKILNPDNVFLNKNCDQLNNYLKLFDCFGEVSVKNKKHL